MKVKVSDACIGCGACIGMCDAVFEMDNDGRSVVKVDVVPEDKVNDVKDAMDSCPTAAISEVEE